MLNLSTAYIPLQDHRTKDYLTRAVTNSRLTHTIPLKTPKNKSRVQYNTLVNLERRKMKDALNTPLLARQLLFITAKGSAALVAFLKKTKIAIASWLLAAGAL
jgi:hypothetical protein